MFSTEEKYTKYSTYTTDDFLLDTFFIRSVQQPSRDTERFWSGFQESAPKNLNGFFEAKSILATIENNPRLALSEPETDMLFGRIMEVNRRAEPKRKRLFLKRLAIAAASVAACAAIVVMIVNTWETTADRSAILSYTESVENIDFNGRDIKLILSEDKVVTSEEVDPDIVYDAEEIKFAAEGIPMAEAAEFNQLIVPYGKRSRLQLADGTKMWVNAGTAVTYPVEFTGKHREIHVAGEVFLDVAIDTEHPFIVRTDNFEVRVLGTRFNISAHRDEIGSVVLESGKVNVSLSDKRGGVDLLPNQMFCLKDGVPCKQQVDAELYTSWIKGIYIFENECLGVVMKRLSKYYGKKIECSAEVEGMRCSGKLNLIDNLDEILNNLSAISSVRFNSHDDDYRIF